MPHLLMPAHTGLTGEAGRSGGFDCFVLGDVTIELAGVRGGLGDVDGGRGGLGDVEGGRGGLGDDIMELDLELELDVEVDGGASVWGDSAAGRGRSVVLLLPEQNKKKKSLLRMTHKTRRKCLCYFFQSSETRNSLVVHTHFLVLDFLGVRKSDSVWPAHHQHSNQHCVHITSTSRQH